MQQHLVADVIARVLAEHGVTDQTVTDDVMGELDAIRLVSYNRKDTLSLLSMSGRVLVLVMEHPDMTMREISMRLGTSESNVRKAITALSKAKLIRRHRVGRKNHYEIRLENVLDNPDILRLVAAIGLRIDVMTNLEADL